VTELLRLLHAVTVASRRAELDDALAGTADALRRHLGLTSGGIHLAGTGGVTPVVTWPEGDHRPPPDAVRRVGDARAVLVEADAASTWIGIPVFVDGAVAGVIEGRGAVPVDAATVDACADVGIVVGHAVAQDRTRSALRAHDDAQALFVARAAHELRGPVATVGVAVTTILARSDRLTSEERARLTTDAETEIERLRHAVSRLTDLADLERGAFAVRSEPVAVDAVARAAAATLPTADVIDLSSEGDVVALADRTAVDHVLSTLLLNATIHGGPMIEVRVRGGGGTVTTIVRDDGDGVPDALAPTIFDAVARSKVHRQGFGLGLPIARRLARACGGDLVHEPVTAGEARFVLTLPAARDR
jgi:signal transduction histidine kinase